MGGPEIDDPDLSIHLLLNYWPETAAVFLRHRIFCFGCPIARFHTVIEACDEYRLDQAAFRSALREAAAVVPA